MIRRVLRYAVAFRQLRRVRTVAKNLTFDEAYAFASAQIGIEQKPEEIRWLFELVRAERPRVVLEIGLDFGGTFFLWSRAAAPDARLLAIDTKPVGRLGMWSPFSLVRRAFAVGSQRVTLLMDSDSHSETTRQRIAALLDGRAIDFLFIHGDHSREGYGGTSRRPRLLWLPADLLRSTISLRIRQSGRRESRSFGESSPSSTRLTSALSMTSPDLGSAFTSCPDDTPSDFKFGLASQLLVRSRMSRKLWRCFH